MVNKLRVFIVLNSFVNLNTPFLREVWQIRMSSDLVHLKKKSDSIIKSALDKRSYRGLVLHNDLKVLLISDPSTDKSAAAMDVNIGFMSDPKDLPGLAHFCEHMLFLGSTKYPMENEYSKYLSEHGGSSNASTSADHTNFYFDVLPEFLPGALDRFAQFFLSPLFTESAMDREVNAVNAEHDKNVNNDSWRLDQLEKSTAKSNHPYSQFGTGNKLTLETIPSENGIDMRHELLKFHDKWYSSNIMTLAILGKEDLNALEDITIHLFSNVINKNVNAPIWLDHPYGPEQLQMKGFIVPIKDLRNLNINFPIPDLQEYFKAGPGHYLSHLIGHEGPGSILSELRARGWCNSLYGGARNGAKGFSFFCINVDLTEEGLHFVDDIVKLIFQYVAMLKNEDPKQWIFDEYKDIMSMHFQFKDCELPRSYVSNISMNLHDYPLEEVLSGPYLLSEWRPDLIKNVLQLLAPSNVRVAVISKSFEKCAQDSEKWYGTKYKLEKISPELIKDWNDNSLCGALHLPPVNDFIPTDFNLVPREENPHPYPVIIKQSKTIRVWFKQDDEFLHPKANLCFEFVSPMAYTDPYCCNMMHMFVLLIKDALNENSYAAELAGLKWDLNNTKYGMVLNISGFNNKQHVLLNKIIEKLTSFKFDCNRFNILKENYVRGLKNFEAEQPYQHAVYFLAVLLAEHAWTKEELISASSDLTCERLEAFIPQMLSQIFIECLVHGNVDSQITLSLIQSMEDQVRSRIKL